MCSSNHLTWTNPLILGLIQRQYHLTDEKTEAPNLPHRKEQMFYVSNKTLHDLGLSCPFGHVLLTLLPPCRVSVTLGFFRFSKGAKLSSCFLLSGDLGADLQFFSLLFSALLPPRITRSVCPCPFFPIISLLLALSLHSLPICRVLLLNQWLLSVSPASSTMWST